jgi:SAM-dependent methyltransferase
MMAEPSRSERLPWARSEHWIRQSLRALEFTGKTVLDVGAGSGLFTCYMAYHGARRVVALEPELDGSAGGFNGQLRSRADSLGLANVEFRPDTFQAYDAPDATFDVILLNNAINHLDESAVVVLHQEEWARATYRGLLAKLRRLLKPGGTAVIADCARDNVFYHLGFRNPFKPTIEWHKHQNPGLWEGLLREAGFDAIESHWTIPTRLRALGWALDNTLAAYLTSSHFVVHANRPAGLQPAPVSRLA